MARPGSNASRDRNHGRDSDEGYSINGSNAARVRHYETDSDDGYISKFAGSVVLNVVTILSICLVAGKTTVGGLSVGKCPFNDKLPIFLIVPGGLLILVPFIIWLSIKKTWRRYPAVWTAIIIFGCFCFAWTVCGTVWVFPVASKVRYEGPVNETYCDKNVFKFALGLTIIDWIIVGLTLIIVLCRYMCWKRD